MRFRLPRPAATFAAGLAVVLLLAGCMPPDPIITPEPGPGATPVFASDEEALAAATDAYAKYLTNVDESLMTYQTSKLNEYSEGFALSDAIAQAEKYEKNHERQVGNARVKASFIATAESVLGNAPSDEPVQIYVCIDLSGVDIVDASGTSVVSVDRPDITPMFVSLIWEPRRGHFVVIEESIWGGSIDC